VLIIALIFITAMGLVVGAMAHLATVDVRNTAATRDQREVVYTADAAVKAAINRYAQTATCPATPALPAVNNISTSEVTVDCVDTTTTGAGGLPTNQPPLAIITRPATGETGIELVSGSVTNVVGGVFSNTDIDVAGGATLKVVGPATTRSGCGGAGTYDLDSTAVNNCSPGIGPSASYPKGDDPNYAPEVSVAPSTFVTLPSSCGAPGSTINMPRGTYNDGAALTAFFNTCSGRVFHFPPAGANVGIYYFDFTNSGSHVWTVDNPATVVVGGTMTATPSTPGSACNETAPGVQFIFGGDSALNVNAAAAFDVCAQHDPTQTQQQIAIYGLKTSVAPPAGPSPADLAPVAPGTATSTAFLPASDGRVVNGASASTAVSSTDSAAKEITLGGFDLSGLPTGSTINSVKLELTHKEQLVSPVSADLDYLTVKATVTGTGATGTVTDKAANCAPACLTKSDTNHVNSADLSADFPTVDSLQGLSVTYSAEAKKKGSTQTSFTASLDGVSLLINYTPPAPPPVPGFHAQSGCVTTVGGCPLITTSGSNGNLALHGTVYAPLANFNIQLTNVGYQVFNRGIVARSLRINLTSSSTCVPPDCSPFRLPTPTPVPASTSVVFQATIQGNKRLRALVDFPVGLPPVVRSWSAVNEL
jgi:hypothetical protein